MAIEAQKSTETPETPETPEAPQEATAELTEAELDARDAEAIRAMKHIAAPKATPEPEPEPEPTEPPEAEETSEAKVEADPETKKPPVSRKIVEIAMLRKRAEQEAQRERAKIAEERSALDETKTELANLKALKQKAITDPAAFYKDLGLKPIDIAKLLAHDEMPENSSSETKLLARQIEQEAKNSSEVEDLKAQIEAMKKDIKSREDQAAGQEIIAAIRGELAQSLTEIPEHLTLVTAQAKSRPEKAEEHMWAFVQQYANEYPDKELPSAVAVLEWYEEYLEENFGRPGPKAPDTKQSNSEPKPPGETLSQKDLAGRATSEDLPEDDDEADDLLAARLRSGAHLSG